MSNDGQLDRGQLAEMTHEEIAQAYKAGRLNKMVGGDYKLIAEEIRREALEDVRQGIGDDKPAPITRGDLKRMAPDEVNRLFRNGELDHLMKQGDHQ